MVQAILIRMQRDPGRMDDTNRRHRLVKHVGASHHRSASVEQG